MNRRSFLYTTFLISNITNADYITVYHNEFIIIDSVLEHMFDKTDIVPSYKKSNILSFVKDTIFHPSYDIEIRDFILHGANILDTNIKDFVLLSRFQKEIKLREFEDSAFGQSWLYRLQILGFEAIYSSPIYGVNTKCKYYTNIDANWGEPLPASRYIEL